MTDIILSNPSLHPSLLMEGLTATAQGTEHEGLFKTVAHEHIARCLRMPPPTEAPCLNLMQQYWETEYEESIREWIRSRLADGFTVRREAPRSAVCFPTKGGWIKTRVYRLYHEQGGNSSPWTATAIVEDYLIRADQAGRPRPTADTIENLRDIPIGIPYATSAPLADPTTNTP